MATKANNLSATEIRRRLEDGSLSAEEVTRSCLEHVERTDAKLHAWVCLAPKAIEEARAIDQARSAGTPLRPLSGVPLGVKDIFNTADLPTEMGSPIWKGFTPGNDARVVFGCRLAGAVLLGKTVTAEFAVHELRETVHPIDPTRNPGTSSTGSAVAVATCQVPLALGTQTAGSIVRPASYCGVYGFKPSFGLIPRTGMLKTTDSLDTVGFFARTPEDVALMFSVVRVKGRDYPVSDRALSDEVRQNKRPGHRWRVAIVRPHTWEFTHGYARDSFDAAVSQWAKSVPELDLVEKALPRSISEAHDVHATIYDKTLAYYFQEEYKKEQLISRIFKQIIEHGSKVDLDQYKAALVRQQELMDDMEHFFGDVDALVTLSVAGEAPLRDETERPDSCLIWTLCGLPALNIPSLSGPNGLPMGVQLVARRYNDPLLLRLLGDLATAGVAPAGPSPKNPHVL